MFIGIRAEQARPASAVHRPSLRRRWWWSERVQCGGELYQPTRAASAGQFMNADLHRVPGGGPAGQRSDIRPHIRTSNELLRRGRTQIGAR